MVFNVGKIRTAMQQLGQKLTPDKIHKHKSTICSFTNWQESTQTARKGLDMVKNAKTSVETLIT